MEGFLIYIGKSALATAAFYLVYLLLFQNKKQFVFNRIYLPVSMLLSFSIPLVTFTRIEYVEAIAQPSTLNLTNLAYLIQEPENIDQFQQVFEWYHYVFGLYILVITGFLVHLSLGYFRANSIVKKSNKKTLFETLVHISFKDVHPFSFFKKIVISNRTINDPNLRMIISHERIHVEENHTLDILLSEVLFMLQWFNPFAWLIKDAIKNNLEYKTDAQIIKHHDPKAYQLAMLSLADKKGVAPFLNALNGSQLKNRIIMMKQKTENKYAIVKQLLVLPILAMLVMGLSSKEVKTEYVEHKIEMETLAADTSVSSKAKIQFDADEAELEEDKIVLRSSSESGVKINVSDTSNAPLIILDGKEIKSVNCVDPASIAEVEILKNKSATALYGERAKDGVVHITSKSKQKEKESILGVKAEKKINGKVTDEKGKPLNGANIIIKGKPIGTITDNDGYFQIKVKDEDEVLIFSKTGYKTKEVNILGKNEIDVQLRELNKEERFFEGLPPQKDSIKSNSKTAISIRDIYSLKSPLIILDGKEIKSVNGADPDSIAEVKVLDDKLAKELYGEKAKDGVVHITSKSRQKEMESILGVKAEKKIKGKVTDEKGEPLNWVNVICKGRKMGTITKKFGNFLIKIEDEDEVLIFSKTGYKTKEVNISGKNEIDVQLRELNKEERFFEGLPPKEETIKSGNSKSRLIILDGKEIGSMDEVDPDIINAVTIMGDGTEEYGEKGKNGVVVITTKKYKDSDLMGYKATNNNIRINGSNFNRDKNPIYVVDGKISDVDLEQFDQETIERVEVMKDKSAIDKYGKIGENGVIEVVTNNRNWIKKSNNSVKVDLKGTDGKNPPMFMLNGEEVDNIDDVDPESIESVNVFKSEQAMEWYGEKGKNGVVFIATKKDYRWGGERTYRVQTVNEDSANVNYGRTDENGVIEITMEGKNGLSHSKSMKNDQNFMLNLDTGVLRVGAFNEKRNKPGVYFDSGVLKPGDQTGSIENNAPKVYLNGNRTSFKLEDINPEAIESVNVLKGDDAIAKYGRTAQNGVVEITVNTKNILLKENVEEKKVAIREVKKRDFDTGALVTSLSLEDTENIPLIFIDGKSSTLNNLESMDVDKIESINVLQKEEAEKEYGNKGKNGAIKILTKK